MELVIIGIWFLLAAWCSSLASARGRNAFVWLVLGAVGGIFAIGLLLLLGPDRHGMLERRLDEEAEEARLRKERETFSITNRPKFN